MKFKPFHCLPRCELEKSKLTLEGHREERLLDIEIDYLTLILLPRLGSEPKKRVKTHQKANLSRQLEKYSALWMSVKVRSSSHALPPKKGFYQLTRRFSR